MNHPIPQTTRIQPLARQREQVYDFRTERIVPFDYVARFEIEGKIGNIRQDVINVSTEGIFVAVAIGYGFDEDRAKPVKFINNKEKLGELTLDDFPPDVLLDGFRIDPQLISVCIKKDGSLNDELKLDMGLGILQHLHYTEDFSFLLSMVDTGTGRELQNEPVHSFATLGRADGRRPFKILPQAMFFMPRSTIRIQIEERLSGIKGRLYLALQGYKILCPEGKSEQEFRKLAISNQIRSIPVYDFESGNYRTHGESLPQGLAASTIIPFDYVSTLDLEGKPNKVSEDEIPINIDGGYVATNISYGLDAGDNIIQIKERKDENNNLPNATATDLNLYKIKLSDITPVQRLFDGIRIHPLRVKFAFTSDGKLSYVPLQMKDRMFQSLNRPEEVRFLYSISDSATGSDWQNQRVHNIAGLGIANGERPFKVLHKPMVFSPRSSIRVQVEEIFGRGRLYIAFQGYKILK